MKIALNNPNFPEEDREETQAASDQLTRDVRNIVKNDLNTSYGDVVSEWKAYKKYRDAGQAGNYSNPAERAKDRIAENNNWGTPPRVTSPAKYNDEQHQLNNESQLRAGLIKTTAEDNITDNMAQSVGHDADGQIGAFMDYLNSPLAFTDDVEDPKVLTGLGDVQGAIYAVWVEEQNYPMSTNHGVSAEDFIKYQQAMENLKGNGYTFNPTPNNSSLYEMRDKDGTYIGVYDSSTGYIKRNVDTSVYGWLWDEDNSNVDLHMKIDKFWEYENGYISQYESYDSWFTAEGKTAEQIYLEDQLKRAQIELPEIRDSHGNITYLQMGTDRLGRPMAIALEEVGPTFNNMAIYMATEAATGLAVGLGLGALGGVSKIVIDEGGNWILQFAKGETRKFTKEQIEELWPKIKQSFKNFWDDELGAIGHPDDLNNLRKRMADEHVSDNTPPWKQYEQKFGGRQTPMTTNFQGKSVTVRLDKPPTDSSIIDFKDYNWSNPSYQKPYIQQQVAKEFAEQIAKYKTIRPNVHFQFSQEPPSWVIEAIKNAGGTYSVAN